MTNKYQCSCKTIHFSHIQTTKGFVSQSRVEQNFWNSTCKNTESHMHRVCMFLHHDRKKKRWFHLTRAAESTRHQRLNESVKSKNNQFTKIFLQHLMSVPASGHSQRVGKALFVSLFSFRDEKRTMKVRERVKEAWKCGCFVLVIWCRRRSSDRCCRWVTDLHLSWPPAERRSGSDSPPEELRNTWPEQVYDTAALVWHHRF